VQIEAIGHVSSPRTEPIDDDWDAIVSTIALDEARFTDDALLGLDAYSHVEVVFQFDRVEPANVLFGARHPRNNPDWPQVGIFAQRAKNRPNRIGTCVCRVLEVRGRTLTVRGLDAIDGTPVLDLKPYMVEFGARGPVRQPSWSHELMARYWDGTGSESLATLGRVVAP
jgi:tRNA-Thr(GGU) m(6)t(6)A37 methyltransferase TsaA